MKEKALRTTKSKATNQDVVMHLIDCIYNIVNSGNFVGLFLLATILLVFFIVWKLPPELLSSHVGTILGALKDNRYPLFALSAALFVSIIGNIVQRYSYKAEIKRLVKVRKLLMHGRKEDILCLLETHNPSDFDLDNGD